MSKAFLFYWIRQQIENAVEEGSLYHAGSNQFHRCSPGDVLWICGPGKGARLVTIGPIQIARIVDYEEASRVLRYTPWDAEYHALASRGRRVVPQEVNLEPILGQLEFASRRRLDLTKPLGQQLQSMRELAPHSAHLLQSLWTDAKGASPSIASRLPNAAPHENPPVGVPLPDQEWIEGSPLLRVHLTRERAPGLSQAKKAQFRQEHGKLYCQRCKFDPSGFYRTPAADACIEVHHSAMPLSNMTTQHATTLHELECLCANCHRLVHAELQATSG
ncbi:hypothetical protein JJB11_12270 [Ramlibacter ginsenosidimutans]|uniref:HNH endonuclease n=1 Tax=Ramlibacter ginsenosidimutans TaxID=502333 RepID=A0A934TSS0_9BURK|nr:hypothetical protein [Ramlibacter ginsenosidimutans]MBK6006867.1 hypothetical protein [Ramlibacter ginsenosidimutans]